MGLLGDCAAELEARGLVETYEVMATLPGMLERAGADRILRRAAS